ncbi:uncharacterized protein LY89DRAFT_664641 [Mollisia scopiformis]|uniref:F-box domain-containing protein n=1 Tax=Mollisia scopiformis TaxID=149040 RepID=A0A194XS33_MOLSC|nr:uncharacterized protein LY89DRAFT_664641 [Mollisia scopiformis]KUJ22859.1 hypothetical protein LY89DRAFT_664641 [Mollisia scopiformis]
MSSRVTRRAGAAAKAKLKAIVQAEEEEEEEEDSYEDEHVEEHEDVAKNHASTVLQTESLPQPVYETFQTAADLSNGLCIVRKLDDGRYEILNLTNAEASTLGNIDTGRLIRGDESGARQQILEEAEQQWKESEFKIGQVLGSVKLRIFRFLKLPIELRFKIYDYTISSAKTLHIGSHQYSPENILGGLHLTGTCRQIFAETRSMFWRNTFRVSGICKQIKLIVPTLTDNLREVTWTWWSTKNRDSKTLRMFADCKKLRKFHLCLTKYCHIGHIYHPTVQHKYQDEPAVQKFCKTNGFDLLVSLRGFELVTVRNECDPTLKILADKLSEVELKAFESFLMQKLTQPKDPDILTYFPVIKTAALTVGKKTSKDTTKSRSTAKASTKKGTLAA